MNRIQYLDIIRRESAALADAAASVDLDTPVPTCPGWSMAKLVTHIGVVQLWAAKLVETRAQEIIPRKSLPQAPTGDALLPWFRAATVTLITTLESTDPATPVFSWTTNRTAAYWHRRQAHEVAVHRWDAEDAAGGANPLPTALAADGVDELFEMIVPRSTEPARGHGESIHLHAIDAPGEWLIRIGSERLEISHAHAKADAAARGTASDLDLFVWGRVSSSRLDVFGDEALLRRLQELTAL